jgi:hypothetical protein
VGVLGRFELVDDMLVGRQLRWVRLMVVFFVGGESWMEGECSWIFIVGVRRKCATYFCGIKEVKTAWFLLIEEELDALSLIIYWWFSRTSIFSYRSLFYIYLTIYW